MNSPRATKLLSLLLVLSAITCAIGAARLGTLKADALASEEDLQQVRHDLLVMGSAHSETATAAIPANQDLNRTIRDAAAQAGLGDALVGIEPGRPGEGGLTPIFLRFEPLGLRPLLTFLHTLRGAAGARIDSIELSAADASAGQERWGATVTVSVRSGR